MDVLSERVRELRQRHRWSAQRLADEMTRVGVKWERIVVSRLETGKRQAVSVTELLALAYVLNTSPLGLLIPQEDGPFQVTPNLITDARTAWDWIVGEGSLKIEGDEPLDFLERVAYLTALPEWKQREQRHQLMEPDEGELVIGDDQGATEEGKEE